MFPHCEDGCGLVFQSSYSNSTGAMVFSKDLRLSLQSLQDSILLHQNHHNNEHMLFAGIRSKNMVAWNSNNNIIAFNDICGGGGGGKFVFNAPSTLIGLATVASMMLITKREHGEHKNAAIKALNAQFSHLQKHILGLLTLLDASNNMDSLYGHLSFLADEDVDKLGPPQCR
ncbi:hypothetical protein JHK87_038430 [Glycine soja]|nr:hypothetical protein JHK87_038430 [Glycine soja]